MNAQTLSNSFCQDVTSKVSIKKLENGRNEFTYNSEKDSISRVCSIGDYELICSVKNDSIINVVYRSTEESLKNMICFLSFFKLDGRWESASSYAPLSPRYFAKEVIIEDLYFPDINTLLVIYKLENGKSIDCLYRITEFGPVAYDCLSSSKEREQVRKSIAGTISKNKYRPSN